MDIISNAQAAAGAAPQGGGMIELAMIFFFVFIFYFLLWRPQNKRQKEHKQLIESIQKGDEIVLSGGVIGKVSKIADAFLVLTVAEGVEIKVQRHAVANVLPKGTLKTIA